MLLRQLKILQLLFSPYSMELIITNHPHLAKGVRVIRDEEKGKKLIRLKWAIQVKPLQTKQENEEDQQLKSQEVNHPTQSPLRLTNSQLEMSITNYRKKEKNNCLHGYIPITGTANRASY